MSVVVGTGLVSPRGLTAAENAFTLRAAIRVTLPSPFLDAAGQPVRVGFCPWLGARMPLAERLTSMASAALAEALAPVRAAVEAHRLDLPDGALELVVCVSPPRPELSQETIRTALAGPAIGAPPTTPVTYVVGPAAFFSGLAACASRLASGPRRVAVVLGVDSFVSVESLEQAIRAPSPWAKQPPRPSEAAAALVLMDDAAARHAGLEPLATVASAATLVGEARDDNDLPTDGAAMTSLLRDVPPLDGPVVGVFGQNGVDSLRESEWLFASARNHLRFFPAHDRVSLENQIGRVGAAAGAAGAAYAIAAARHRTLALPPDVRGPLLAWAISPDGARGLCALRVPDPAPAARGAAHA